MRSTVEASEGRFRLIYGPAESTGVLRLGIVAGVRVASLEICILFMLHIH